MKLIKFAIYSLIVVLALGVGLLFAVQSEWAKDKIGLVLQEIALQQGVRLKIGKIEGSLPLKWTLSDLHLQFKDSDTLDIDRLHLRLALFPLLRNRFTISYLNADKTILRFTPTESAEKPAIPLIPLTVRQATFDSVEIVNQKTNESATYTIEGNCQASSLFAKVVSPDLELKVILQRDDQLSGDLFCHVKSARAFAPFKIFPYATAFKLEALFAGHFGELTLDVDQLAIPELRGLSEKLHLSTQFALDSDALELSSFSLKSDLLCLKGRGRFNADYFPTEIEATFLMPHISRLNSSIEGIVKGDVHYNQEMCFLVAKSDRLDIRNTTFTDVELKLKSENWNGSCEFIASHPTLNTKGSAYFQLDKVLTLSDLEIQCPGANLNGDFVINLHELTNLQGGASFQINDLRPFSSFFPWRLAGQIGGTLDLREKNVNCRAVAKNLEAGPLSASKINLDLFVTDLFKEMKGQVNLETHEAILDELFLKSFYGSLGWDKSDWLYSFQAEGEWKEPFDLTSQGRLDFGAQKFQLTCNTIVGQLLGNNLFLDEPFILSRDKDIFQLQNFHLKIEDGQFQSSIHYSPEHAKIVVQASQFPLDFLTLISPRFSLQGLSAIDVDLEGTSNFLEGHCSFLLQQANIYPAGTSTPIQTKGSLQANIEKGVVQFHTHLVASGEQFFDLSATVPIKFSMKPLSIEIEMQKQFSAQCTMEGHAEQLFDFINLGTQRVGGFVSCNLILSGSIDQPTLFGPFSLQGGFYQNYFIGMSIKGVNADAIAQGKIVTAKNVQATDGEKGTSLSNATFWLQPKLPFEIEGEIKEFKVIQFDWLTAACSGPFKITGNLDKGLAQGTLNVDMAEIHIPENLPSDLPVLPVTFVNQPTTYIQPHELHSEPYPFHYDLTIHGQENIRLSGRGLEAQLAGDLHLTGKNLTVSAIGSLQTTKGQFSFAGKDFNITQGEITFSESQTFLNITSNLDMPDLKVTVIFRGALTSPELIFQSNPPLPTGALLARILFNKDVSELTASQALQLADTVLTLSGGAGPNVMETIRKNLGIDRLSISASEETGKVSVQIGKKVAKGVMITLNQSTETSHILVEVELKGGFVLSAETQEDDQGKFTFKWNKNY